MAQPDSSAVALSSNRKCCLIEFLLIGIPAIPREDPYTRGTSAHLLLLQHDRNQTKVYWRGWEVYAQQILTVDSVRIPSEGAREVLRHFGESPKSPREATPCDPSRSDEGTAASIGECQTSSVVVRTRPRYWRFLTPVRHEINKNQLPFAAKATLDEHLE